MSNDFCCLICKKPQTVQFAYQLKLPVCDECAETVANLWHEARSGEYLTWPDPNPKPRPPRKGFSATQKLEVWKRDGFKCVKCGSDEDLTVDHIHPRSKGGSDDMTNLQTLCRGCNSRKCAKSERAA
jgi:HNH endonuclease